MTQNYAPYTSQEQHDLTNKLATEITKIKLSLLSIEEMFDNLVGLNQGGKMGEHSVKETLELLDGIKKVAALGATTFADGVQISDLGALAVLAKDYGSLSEAVKGVNLIDDELKDLDEAEVAQILSKVFEIVREVKAAYEEAKPE